MAILFHKKLKLGTSVKILSGAFKNRLGFVDFIDNNNLSVLINTMKITLSLEDTRLKAAGLASVHNGCFL
jgi:transcription antitermination factor NusG